MKIEISGNGMKVTEALHDHARKKVERLAHYLPNISDVRVEFSHEHARRGDHLNTVQITVRHQRGAILRAQESTQGDSESAFNDALERLHRQIERFKGRRSRKGHPSLSASMEELQNATPAPFDNAADQAEEEVITIVRRKAVAVTAMDDEEAIEQMELLGHDFFVYYDESVGAISVAYKRRVGGYGILTPKLI